MLSPQPSDCSTQTDAPVQTQDACKNPQVNLRAEACSKSCLYIYIYYIYIIYILYIYIIYIYIYIIYIYWWIWCVFSADWPLCWTNKWTRLLQSMRLHCCSLCESRPVLRVENKSNVSSPWNKSSKHRSCPIESYHSHRLRLNTSFARIENALSWAVATAAFT